MSRLKVVMCLAAAAVASSLSSVASAVELVTTGSGDVDVVLQGLTTIVTLASIAANFTPSPVDNAGVRLLSLLVNLAAANWKSIRAAWDGKGLLAIALPASILGAVLGGSSESAAATCPPISGVTCPAYTICFQIAAPTARQGGEAFSVSELEHFELGIAGRPVIVPPAAVAVFNYKLEPDEQIKAGSAVIVVAVDTFGRKSDAAACTLAKGVTGPPKSRPAAPVLNVGFP